MRAVDAASTSTSLTRSNGILRRSGYSRTPLHLAICQEARRGLCCGNVSHSYPGVHKLINCFHPKPQATVKLQPREALNPNHF